MAGLLITNRELALWTGRDASEVARDPWAAEVIEKFSDYARFLSGVDWARPVTIEGEVDLPFDARMAILQACRRTYGNPDSEVQTSVGPISSRILDEAALAGAFTEAEMSKIQAYNPSGSPDSLWVLTTTRGIDPLPVAEVLFVSDDRQVNLGLLDPWGIPMFSPGDPGGEG